MPVSLIWLMGVALVTTKGSAGICGGLVASLTAHIVRGWLADRRETALSRVAVESDRAYKEAKERIDAMERELRMLVQTENLRNSFK